MNREARMRFFRDFREKSSVRVPWAACPPLMPDGCGWVDKGGQAAHGTLPENAG